MYYQEFGHTQKTWGVLQRTSSYPDPPVSSFLHEDVIVIGAVVPMTVGTGVVTGVRDGV